jgi:AAA domain/UvrD-like helicase C-terminal domain
MATLSPNAKQLPLRHLSLRVPWHDSGWNGTICRNPSQNSSCLILPHIRETRQDTSEIQLAGTEWQKLEQAQWPPCIGERGGFMAPFELSRLVTHPYAETSPAHRHFAPTPFRIPAYAAPCIPFSWMLKEMAAEKVQLLDLNFRDELEQQAHGAMGFETSWVQTKHNHLVMLDTFFSAVQPQRSLCFFYAKATPLTDDPRRVIVGVGWVTSVGPPVEYRYQGDGPIQALLWERVVQHSIRPEAQDGFLLPYQDLVAYLDQHPDEQANDYIAFAPDDHFWSFSYGAEHVSNDGAIGSLLACARAVQQIAKVLPGAWDSVLRWIDQRLNELWQMRGPHPGLGAALSAFGVEKGTLLAYDLEYRLAIRHPEGNIDPWPLVDELFRAPENLPANLRSTITPTLSEKWRRLPAERRQLLQLLSRFDLLADQASRYYVHEDAGRSAARIQLSDADILRNPYLLYESDRQTINPIGVDTVDRGLFPDLVVREKHPLPEPSLVNDPTDPRRVRAFVIERLELAALQGDTLLPRVEIIRQIRESEVQPACPIDGDLMNIVDPFLAPVVADAQLADGTAAYQLNRLHTMGAFIRREVERRTKAKPHSGNIDWRKLLDAQLDAVTNETERRQRAADPTEQDARNEKTAALEQIFASRVSVLIGPAGTGKTTLLQVLCSLPDVARGGVLLLAPTGKARVRLETQTGLSGAKTIAQFLVPIDRYDPQTGVYRLSDRDPVEGYKTVVVDEASMLTEEQLAALLNGIRGVERLVLVGDPRQLPPIGAGRPFLDMVRRLAPDNVESRFPRVGPNYAELTVRRRQVGKLRDDLLLAEWFSGRPLEVAADEIWDRIGEQLGEQQLSENLRFVRWENDSELQARLLEILQEELQLTDTKDSGGFEQSLGGTPYGDNGAIFFWAGRAPGELGACGKVEAWQILSPTRGAAYGVEALNRLVQTTFRSKTKEYAQTRWRKIPKPMGREEILYGDKVICTTNQRRKDVFPEMNSLNYVANGEIGIVVGQYKTKTANYRGLPWKLEVEFSSQPGYRYDFKKWEFGDERAAMLELAYALTIHRTQGSEFGRTIVILPNPCRLLSRELLYTALTRQRDRLVILHQGDIHELLRYSEDSYSEAARRLSNLFSPPCPVKVADRFLEEGLIHRTLRSDSVRSKSEVIIANMLYQKGISDYRYEARLTAADGSIRYPDFTIEDSAMGTTYYWEHLGMLRDPSYRARWERKLAWYRAQNILPLEDGGGQAGTLIITTDDAQGGIDSAAIAALIDQTLVG